MDLAGGRFVKKGVRSTAAGEWALLLFPEVGRELGCARGEGSGDGGSCMVSAGSFLLLRPIAEASVLNLREGRASLGLGEALDAVEAYFSSSSARLATERTGRRESLEDFERDHHGLLGAAAAGAGGIEEREGKERGLPE